MSGPVRIQRQRTKGWRMPEGAVYVGRPSRFGNPYVHNDPAVAVQAFREFLAGEFRFIPGLGLANGYGAQGRAESFAMYARTRELRGKNLVCWCKPGSPCHADVLLELANAPAESSTP